MIENLSRPVVKGYELFERIGAGAFGAVYRAYQSSIGREVAVKIILPGFASHPDFIRRFEIEAQLVARLEHLHIVPLYDFWRDPSGAYLVMRWLRGGSLLEVLRERPYDLAEAARLLDQVSSALAAAHRRDIIHRDLKPANILLDEEGNAYLTDFGIARDLGQPAGSLEDGEAILGSPGYLSPEQIRRELVTSQSDIYALGVVVYEALTGQHPFPQAGAIEGMYSHLEKQFPPIDSLPSEVQYGINEVIRKATEKNPRSRYKDVLEMAAAFRKAAQIEQLEIRAPSEPLTGRELEILNLIVKGRSNKQIAQELFVELTTVKWYITQIYRKLDVRGRMQAIQRAHNLQLLAALDSQKEPPSSVGIDLARLEQANPYKGLRAFEEADSRDFFGREALVEKLIRRLGESRFLAVVGPSGCGKSSLLKAGLVPALRRGALPGSERWFLAVLAPGPRPVDALEVALTRIAADQGENIRGHLDRDDLGLLRAAGLILPLDGSELVIVIDQFEEAYALAQDDPERRKFLSLLWMAASQAGSRVRIAIALRADFYDRPLQDPQFGDLVRRNLETVLPLSAGEIERAIVHPAEGVGVSFEPGLAANILEEVLYQPGALPLLQYALTELFDHRQDEVLTHQAYEAIGRSSGALAKRAEEIYRELGEAGKEAVRQVFLHLVALGEGDETRAGGPATRRQALRQDLLALDEDPELVDDILETYAAYRLLSLGHDSLTRKPTVALAHEAILKEWERLKVWIEDGRQDLVQHRRLSALSREWWEAGQEPSYLLQDTRLDQASAWAEATRLKLSPDERAFLQASLDARQARVQVEAARLQRELEAARNLAETARRLAETERGRAEEQAKSASRLRRRALLLTAALLASLALALAALAFWRQSETQRRLASARELAASALSNLPVDPELSILLSLSAADQTYPVDRTLLPEVRDALHRSVGASRLLLTLPHGGAAALSPDGLRLATGGADGSVKTWEFASGRPLLSLHAQTVRITDLAYGPDGKRLAAASLDGTVRIWDADSGDLLLSLSHPPSVYSLAFSPDGGRLAAGGEKETKVWDARSGAELLSIQSNEGQVGGVAFTPDGARLVTQGAVGVVRGLDAYTGETIFTLPVRRAAQFLSKFGLSPTGRLLAAASSQREASVWDLASVGVTPIATMVGHSGSVLDLKISPDGTRLATASEDGTARLWDILSGQPLLTLAGHTQRVTRLAFNPDGSRLVTSSYDGTTRVWDITVQGGREWLTLTTTYSFGAGSASYSPNGKLLAGSFVQNSVLWDAQTGVQLGTLPGAAGRRAFSRDGTRIATITLEGTLALWQVSTGQRLAVFLKPDRITAVDFSPNGRRVAAGDAQGNISVWELQSGMKILDLKGGIGGISDLHFSPNGGRLAAAGKNGMAVLLDAEMGKRIFALPAQKGPLWGIDFSPDGKRLATAGDDGSAIVWDAESGKELLRLAGHPGRLVDVAFSPDGRSLASGSLDNTVILWDVSAGKPLFTLAGPPVSLTGLAFQPDGKRLAVSTDDRILRVYALDDEGLLALASARVTRPLTQAECQRYLHLGACP